MVLYGDASDTREDENVSRFLMKKYGGADHFIVGGNTNAKIMDYNPEEGDKISGKLKKVYNSNENANEQQQTADVLNAILLKGNGESK